MNATGPLGINRNEIFPVTHTILQWLSFTHQLLFEILCEFSMTVLEKLKAVLAELSYNILVFVCLIVTSLKSNFLLEMETISSVPIYLT